MNHRAVAAISCALLAAAIAAAAAAPTPRPRASATSPTPSPTASSGGSIVSSGPAQTRFGDLTVNFSEGEGNLKTGDFVMPSTVTGHSSDGTFRGDRAFGNSKRDEVTLIGHVLVHKLGGVGGNGKKPSEPVTLTCDKLEIYNKRKIYVATGHVKVVQGDKTLTAPLMRLDDTSHDASLTGGVHAEEPPDRTFDAAEVLYNTKSENFKALGGVQATFPLKSSPTPAPPPTAAPLPSSSASPRAPRPSPTPTHT
jgi:hypothetical protein